MALASLLQRQAVLHLAGSDVLLPSVNSIAEEELSETEKHSCKARRNFKALQSRFKRPGIAATSLESTLGLLSGTSSSSSRGVKSQSSSVGEGLQKLVCQFSDAFARGGAPANNSSPTLAIMSETLAIGATLLGRWAQEAPSGKVPLVARAVQECYQWTQLLSQLYAAREDPKQRQLKFLDFISQLTARVKELPPGGLIIVPVGWLRRLPTEDEGEDGGHCLLLVLVRHLADEDFTVAVVNSGEGLQYHPMRSSGAIPRPELPARQCPMVLVNVPRARITCGTFWYLLCRQLVHPSASNGAQFLYATLLPMLNKQPLAANFGKEPSGWVQFYPLPVAGDGSFTLCFMWAVRFCLRASGVSDEGAAWSIVQLRRYVVDAIGHALDSQGKSPIDVGDLAIVRTAASSLARAAGEHVDRFGESARGVDIKQLQDLVRKVQQSAWRLETSVRDAHSLLPPVCASEVVSGVRESSELRFGDFQRLLSENVEMLKGEVNPPRALISVPTSSMPLAVKDPFEAADCCRLASHLLTLLSNQAEHLAQSAVARFALIARLMTQLLPMPLPLSHPQKGTRCFWMQDMKQETKTDLMRHLHLISRHFAAVCFALKASRETDGARVVVSAAIAAIMDALLRRPFANTLHTSLATSHYAGHAEGPSLPFGVDPGPLRKASETLLLVAPEYQALRALVLDYFESVRIMLRDDHVVFSFDRDMSCSAGDYALVEQIGLCLGLEGARREAPLLLSGERPEVLELFPELGWFRDVVFLWKMLLLPASASPAEQNWRSSDTSLRWMWKSGRFEVQGFGSAKLSPEVSASKQQNLLQGVLRWFGQYASEDKSLSRASPSVLLGTGVELNSEDDVLFVNQLPTFNGALGLADSELLLSYLTAPYLRIPLLLVFFTDRNRISALREPQLQSVLDAALFEPGQWQPPSDANVAPPDLVPAPDRRHLATPVGLLFNELTRAPKPVVEAMRCMLRVAVEKDVGRPDSGNQGFILYIIRLAIRIESYLLFIIEHGRRGAYLERSGANYEAFVRGLAGQQDSLLLAELQECHAQLRMELQGDIYRMLDTWAEFASSRGDKLLEAACRVHAHIALLFKNVPNEKLSVCDVSSFLSAQVFLNLNHRWLGEPGADLASQDASANSTAPRLGVGEVELFDAFESRRSRIVTWIRENVDDANTVFRTVERTVTPSGMGTDWDQKNQWAELRYKGNFAPIDQVAPSGWFAAQPGETFRQWLLRTTQGMPGTGGRQISVNLGQYGAKRDGLELLPTWAVRSKDYLEAIGRTDAHCTEREAAAHRLWKDLVSHDGFSVQRWAPDNRGPEGDTHAKAWLKGRVYRPENLSSTQAWIHQVLGPVQDAVPKLQGLEFRLSSKVSTEAAGEIWMGALVAPRRADQEETLGSQQLMELRVQRQPPVVEVYNVIEHGRQFYRSLCFSSDTAWSFHSPSSNQLLLQNCHCASWSVAAGDINVTTELSHSVVVLRSLPDQVGRQTHVPKRFLHGLLPDALLQRYRFWRCDNARAFSGALGKIFAEEMHQTDSPTCLQITIEQEPGKAAAKVQRFELRNGTAAADGKMNASPDHLENDSFLTLINLRRAPSNLTHVLARLENLSQILVWAAPDGKVSLVELPRLRLSFTAVDGQLLCDQHHGFWLADKACTEWVSSLLCQWGGGTALLENSSGELRVLVSALAEPIRPANGPFVDGFLPTRLALRRGSDAWVANLAEGSRHYCYALHVSGTFAFTPTPAAGLYLLICRFLTWHFKEAAAMASTLSEISSSEEKQLWDRLYLLASAHHPDAAACYLRLALATGPFRSTGKGLDTGHILLEYVRKMHLLTANCQLSSVEELQLLASQVQAPQAAEAEPDSPPTSVLQLPELAMRRAALQQLLTLSMAEAGRLELPAQPGKILEDDGFDRICDKTFMAEVGLLERISSTFTDVTYNRPQETRMQGHRALEFLESLFSSCIGSLPGPDFPLLYEFFTGTLLLEVVAGDDSNVAASSLLRVCCRDTSKSASLSVLRALELNTEMCKVMPKWGSSDSSWSFGIGVLTVDTQSASKLLEAAGQKLKSLERSLAWPRSFPSTPLVPKSITTEVQVGKYLWSAPLTGDVLCKSRSLGASLARNFGDKPLQEMFAKYTSTEKGGDGVGQGMTTVLKALDVCKQSTSAGLKEDQLMLDRLWNEVKRISQEPAGHLNLGATTKLDSRASALAKDLEKQRAQDGHALEEAIEAAVELANRGSSSDWLRRVGGLCPQLGFSSLVAALMADEPGATAALRQVNATLSSADDISKLREIVAQVLLTTVRVGQVARVQQCLQQLCEERSQASSEQAVALRAQAVAAELGASRHYVVNVRSSSSEKNRSHQAVYDPRLLVFEFLCNIVLRESQVVLLQAFMAKAQVGQSVCQQMIMGEGKTTVISPLLILLLADGEKLVCACTPPALLDMSRAVMAERFSSPVLPRPVLTFSFHRHMTVTRSLVAKLEAARRGRAAVVAAPASIKSVLLRRLELMLELTDMQRAHGLTKSQSDLDKQGSWLRFPSWLSTASTSDKERDMAVQVTTKAKEICLCGEVMKIFHGGVMLLDEVDLLLDPLRSELNWPLGRRYPLDLSGPGELSGQGRRHHRSVRYTLPFNLLDAVFAAATGCSETAPTAARRDAQIALGALAEKIKLGRRELKVQVAPHFVLLSREFYTQEMLPHLADWAAVLVEEHLEGRLAFSDLKALLRCVNPDTRVRQQLRTASQQALKILNLTIRWLHDLMPYLLSKVHRVSYGLLTGRDLDVACHDSATPMSRKLLAVPFVGKDAPSASAEFSNPDVTIGFTILAYRLNGLRERDAAALLKVLLEEMRSENTVRYHRRAACKAYVTMITHAGGRVRGFTEDGKWLGDLKDEEQRRRSEAISRAGKTHELEDRRQDVWPLELLDLSDPDQTRLVFDVLRLSPLAIRHLLEHHSFLAGTLDRNETQLTASGQELAGPQLFGRCLGFSGTPNNLLPRPMGTCIYAAGDDGKILQTLSSTQTVSVVELETWSPKSILNLVAKARAADRKKPKYQAFIDSGALVTGMTNKEVAEYLLKEGLEGLDGVLYLNEKDERVVLERDGLRIVELAQCGLRPEQRFTFYDHVHTTGMDVKQPLLCTACLTLSKDMTFRDYSQGAYRMRGIGRGQQIELLIIPEVFALMHKSLSKAEGIAENARATGLATLKKKTEAWKQRVVVDVISWLLLNGIRAEASKRQLLREQDLRNVWRSAACQCFVQSPLDASSMETWVGKDRTKNALAELVTQIDFAVSADVPGEAQQSSVQRLRTEASQHVGKGRMGQSIWMTEAARDVAQTEVDQIIASLERSLLPISVAESCDDLGLCSEQVQEQEQEQQEEQEEDHEQQAELEEEIDRVPEFPSEQKYARDCEEAIGWPIQKLMGQLSATTTGVPSGLPFYPLSDFAVNKGILNESCSPLEGLPEWVMLSENYYRHTWRFSSVRRLRNVMCFIEFVPSIQHLGRISVSPGLLSEEQRARLKGALEFCGGERDDCSAGLGRDEVHALCRVLDLHEEGDAFVAGMPAGSRVSLQQLEREVSSKSIFKMQKGRFFVAISLKEAEHLRASMHLMKPGTTCPSGFGLALRCIGCKESGRDNSLLDSFGPVLKSSELSHQLRATEQIFRFLNCAEDFQANEINLLLRTMQSTRLRDRLPWWIDVRACRRRSHRPWQRLALAKLFTRADEFEEWAAKALLLRTRWSMAAQQLWPADAFRLMDTSNNGCLQLKELQVGLERLGVKREGVVARWDRQVEMLFHLLDKDDRKVLFIDDFRAALELGPDDWEAPKLDTSEVQSLHQQSPERKLKELPRPDQLKPTSPVKIASPVKLPDKKLAATDTSSLQQMAAAAAAPTPLRSARISENATPRISPGIYTKLPAGRFKLKWQRHTAFRPLWSSGAMDNPLSIWTPINKVPKGMFLGVRRGSNAVKERVGAGHYVSTSFTAPTGVSLLEVTDEQHSGFFAKHPRDELNRFMAAFFPQPVRFRQVWRRVENHRSLYIWEAIPPSSEFVAAGMVFTQEDEAPALDEIRCIPRAWAERLETANIIQVWTEVGEDGCPAGFWSARSNDNSLGLLHVTVGAAAQVAPEIHILHQEPKKYYAAMVSSE